MNWKVLVKWYKKEITLYTNEALIKAYIKISRMEYTKLNAECMKAIQVEMKKRAI